MTSFYLERGYFFVKLTILYSGYTIRFNIYLIFI